MTSNSPTNSTSNPLSPSRLSRPSTNNLSLSLSSSNTNSFSVGDRVKASNSMVGRCAFIGTIENKPGLWVGIDLSKSLEDPDEINWYGKGKNSGSVNGVKYFECDKLCGIFFPINKVISYPSSSTIKFPRPASPIKRPSSPIKQPPSPNKQPPSPIKRPSSPNKRPSSPTKRVSSPIIRNRASKVSLPSHTPPTTPRPKPRASLHHHSTRKSIGNLLASLKLPSNPLSTPHQNDSNNLGKSINHQFKRSPVPSIPIIPSPSSSSNNENSCKKEEFEEDVLLGERKKSLEEEVEEQKRMFNKLKDETEEERLEILKMKKLIDEERLRLEDEKKLFNDNKKLTESSEESVKNENKLIKEEIEKIREESENYKKVQDDEKEEIRKTQEKEMKTILEKFESERQIWKSERTTLEEQIEIIQTEKNGWIEEREDLIEQLASLRVAGQSLCGLYEKKMAEVESRRIEAVEELRKEIEKNIQETIEIKSEEVNIGNHNSTESIYIDNERLKADLKYNKERLNILQDELYELKQELINEVEKRENIEHELNETKQKHKNMIKTLKDEQSLKSIEKDKLELKLNSLEIRFKECLETMEKDRFELENLRDELMISSTTSTTRNLNNQHPTNMDEDSGGNIDQPEQIEMNTNNNKLEKELKIAKDKIKELENYQQNPKTNLNSNSNSYEEDSEKLILMKQYQTLINKKTEENQHLINNLTKLEEQINQEKIICNTTPIKNRLIHKKMSFGSNNGSIVSLQNNHNESFSSFRNSHQEILGLKVLLNSSDEDRVKVENENKILKREISELKEINKLLEESIKNPKKFIKNYDKTKRLENDIQKLSFELDEIKRKHHQQILSLNQEVSDLEAIIEHKTIKETELENELNQFKLKLQRND